METLGSIKLDVVQPTWSQYEQFPFLISLEKIKEKSFAMTQGN